MKKFLLVAIFALSLVSFGQTEDKQPLSPDSLMQKTNEQKDSISNKITTIKPSDNYDDIDQNMRYFQEIQKKNNAKKKRDAIVRIGIGIGFIVLLVIGLRRKRKTKAD